MLDIGLSEDWFGLQIALAPCIIGYGVAARALLEDEESTKRVGNPYWSWVETYVAEDYVAITQTMRGMQHMSQITQIYLRCSMHMLTPSCRPDRGICSLTIAV